MSIFMNGWRIFMDC